MYIDNTGCNNIIHYGKFNVFVGQRFFVLNSRKTPTPRYWFLYLIFYRHFSTQFVQLKLHKLYEFSFTRIREKQWGAVKTFPQHPIPPMNKKFFVVKYLVVNISYGVRSILWQNTLLDYPRIKLMIIDSVRRRKGNDTKCNEK